MFSTVLPKWFQGLEDVLACPFFLLPHLLLGFDQCSGLVRGPVGSGFMGVDRNCSEIMEDQPSWCATSSPSRFHHVSSIIPEEFEKFVH